MSLINLAKLHSESTKSMEENFNDLLNLLKFKSKESIILNLTLHILNGNEIRLAELEYLCGLIVQNDLNSDIEDDMTTEEFPRVRILLQNILDSWELSDYSRKLKDVKDPIERERKRLLASVTSDYVFKGGESELSLVRYHHEMIFGPHAEYLIKKVGFDVSDAWDIIILISNVYNNRLDNVNKKGDIQLLKFDIEQLMESSGNHINKNVLEAFFNIFTLDLMNDKNDNFKYPTDDNIFKDKPIIKIENSYILPNISTLIWALGYVLEDLLITDSAYEETFTDRRGKYLEEEVNKMFTNIFPEAKVYSSLYYYVVEDGVEKRCELDHLIIYDSNIILAESKSGKFSRPARRGALNSFNKAVRENIERAFEQANRTREFINKEDKPIFYNEKDEIVLELTDKKKYINYYLLNVTLENFGEVATNIYTLKEIGTYRHDEFPWSVNLYDLQKISFFIEFPTQFLHYMHRRLKVDNLPNTKIISFYELDLFYNYMKMNLYFDDLAGNIVFLEPGGEEVIKDLIKKRSFNSLRQNIDTEFKNILLTLDSNISEETVGTTEIILTLLELSEKARNKFIKTFSVIKEKAKVNKGKIIEVYLDLGEDIGINIISCTEKELNLENWKVRCMVRRYQENKTKWLSFIKYYEDVDTLFDKYILIVGGKELEIDHQELEKLSSYIKPFHKSQFINL